MNNRNRPCSCGSGVKFKRCCGDNAKLSVKRREEHEEFLRQMVARNIEREKQRKLLPRASRPSPMLSAILAAAALGSHR